MDYSYSYQNTVRDLSDEFAAIVQAAPVLLSLISFGTPATNTKHEWLEDVLAPAQDVTTATTPASGAGDTTIAVATGSKFAAGQILAVDGSDELIKVASVAGNSLTVERGYGSSTPEAIASGAIVRIVARPKLQGTDPGDDKTQEPSVEFNYTQIIDRTAKISKTAQAVKMYGIDDALNYQVQVQLDQAMRELNTSIIYGRKVAPSAGVPSMMGGLLQFLSQSGGNVTDAASAAITDVILNNAIEQIAIDGGKPVTLLCNTNQARKITGLNRSASNYTVTQDSKQVGNVVYQFVNDLPMGMVQSIVVDINMPKDTIAILDPSRLKLVPLQGRAFQDEDARLPGADYWARRVLGEYTLEVKNAKLAHGIVKNLAV